MMIWDNDFRNHHPIGSYCRCVKTPGAKKQKVEPKEQKGGALQDGKPATYIDYVYENKVLADLDMFGERRVASSGVPPTTPPTSMPHPFPPGCDPHFGVDAPNEPTEIEYNGTSYYP